MKNIAVYVACQDSTDPGDVELRAAMLGSIPNVGDLTHMMGPNLWQIAEVIPYQSAADVPLYLCLVHQGEITPKTDWEPYKAKSEYPEQALHFDLSSHEVEVGAAILYTGETPEIGSVIPAGWIPTEPLTKVGGVVTSSITALPGIWRIESYDTYSSTLNDAPYRHIYISHCENIAALVA